MARMVTPVGVTAFYMEYEKNHIMQDGVIPKWFHGITSRKQADELLMTKLPGHFLIRVSESRIGYTLSYRTEEGCRHFMIDIIPGNQCEIVGEKLQHSSLHDLIAFHRSAPIHPYTELLTVACDKAGQNMSEDMPHALPVNRRVSYPLCPKQNPSMSPSASTRPPSLYPNLERELSALNLDSVVSPLNPTPMPRTKFIPTPPEITTRWQSEHTKTTTCETQSTGLRTAYNQRKAEEKLQQRSEPETKHTRLSMIQCRNVFKKKKKSHSEEHTHMKINETKVTSDSATLQRASSMDQQKLDGVSGTLPLEYLNPSPFAPGY